MIARLPRCSERRLARYLVAWWIGSIATMTWLFADYVLPVDVHVNWVSWWGLEVVAFVFGSWLVPGFLLGGWKALLVAVGRSSIRTTTDRAVLAVFSLWAIGWPLLMGVTAARHGLI